MNQIGLTLIKESFKRYADILFKINNDLFFWNQFFQDRIEEFVSKDHDASRRVYEAIMAVYDIPHDNTQGWISRLNLSMEKTVLELYDWYGEFWGRTVNLYIGKAYNEMELVLIEVIQGVYFPTISSTVRDRAYYSEIRRNIIDFLKNNSISTRKIVVNCGCGECDLMY